MLNVIKLDQKWNHLPTLALIGPMDFTNEVNFNKESGLIFVDAGARHQNFFNTTVWTGPRYLIGDGDSHTSKESFNQLFPAKKDYTDLELALKALPDEIVKLELWGFIGGRRDHELACFGNLAKFLIEKNRLDKVTFDGIHYILGPGHHELNFNGAFSVLAFYPTIFDIEGKVEYATEGAIELETFSGRGISNAATGDFSITCNQPVLVWRNI